MVFLDQLPDEIANIITMAQTGLGQSDLDAMDLSAISLVRWTVDAARLAIWRRETDDASVRTAIDLVLTPPEQGLFDG